MPVPHVGPDVAFFSELLGNTVTAPVVQLAGSGTMAQFDQFGVHREGAWSDRIVAQSRID